MTAPRCLIVLGLLSCHREPTPEQRHEQINHIARGCDVDAWAQLVTIASSSEHEARCWAVTGLEHLGGESPQLYIGAQAQQCGSRFEQPELRDHLEVLLQDQSLCGSTPIAETVEMVAVLCPVPGMEKFFADHSLDRATHALKYLAAWHPTPAAKRVEELVADGDVVAFRRLLAALAAPAEERAQTKDTMLAGLLWLERRAGLTRGRRCFDELGDAIADGDLGADLVAHLDDPDPDIREALLLVLQMRPRPSSRKRLEEMEAHDPDSGIQLVAHTTLGWLNRGGEAAEISSDARTR